MPAPTKIYGLLDEVVIDPRDWRVGMVSGADRIVLKQDGDWTQYLPDKEYQGGVYFDTMACVTFSALNVLETLGNQAGRKDQFSDRFTAKVSGTTRSGNHLSRVADSIPNVGVVNEELWPFPRTQRAPVFDWDDYYCPVPNDLLAIAKQWADTWDVQYEWVPTEQSILLQMLKYGPIQVTVYAWPHPVNGVYYDVVGQPRNHAVMLIHGDGMYWYIFDHYDAVIKKLPWEYGFGAAKRFTVKPKQTPMLQLPNDTFVQLVEAPGGFGLFLDGKIIVDDLAKVLASWHVRTKGVTAGRTAPLTKAQWDSVPKRNLKGETVL